MIHLKGSDPFEYYRITINPEDRSPATKKEAEEATVELVIIGDLKVARRCAEIFDLDFDEVLERNSEHIAFEILKRK